MPTTKQAQEQQDNRPYRTGPNVDIGLEPGAVTVDPQTAEGVAAENARKANGAKSSTVDDGVEVVTSITDNSDDRMDDGRRIALKAEGDPKVTGFEAR